MLTGYLTTLPTDTLLSAGVLFATRGTTYAAIGVTDGAPDFDPGTELGEIMFDNRASSRLKGLSRRVGFQPVFKGTFKEFGPSASGGQLQILEPGSTEATVSGVTTETPKPAGALFASGDYISNLRWIFERAGGGYAAIYAPLAIVRKWSVKGQDKKEPQISFEIEAIGDPVNDLGTGPYAIETRTGLPTGTPTTPAQLIAAFNSAGAARMVGLFIASGADASSSTRTVVADGSSPTGFRLTTVENLCNIGGGQHFRPTATFPSGTPCLSDGSVVNELEVPGASTGNLVTNVGDTTPLTPTIPGAGTLIDILGTGGKGVGMTWGTVGKQKVDFGNSPKAFKVGEDASATTIEWDQSSLLGTEAVGGSYQPRAEFWCGTPGSGLNFANNGSKAPVHASIYITTTVNDFGGFAVGLMQFGRDIPIANTSWDANNFLLAGRRLRWGTGHNNDAASAKSLLYCIQGRANAAQWKLLCDYIALKYPTILEDTNPLAILLGSSYTAQISSASLVYAGDYSDALLGDGTHWPCFANAAIGARKPFDLYPYVNLFRDLDYSKRTTPVVFYFGEEQNAEGVASVQTENYYTLDQLRTVVTGGKVISVTEPFFQTPGAASDARLADMRANALSHADALLDIAFWTAYDTQYVNDGSVANEDTIYWSGQHPTALHQGEKRAWLRVLLRNFWGLASSTGLAVTARPAAGSETVNLSAGTPTANPAVTFYDVSKSVVGGKTATHSSANTGVATVNSSTGLITRVAAGTTYRLSRVTSDHTEAIAVTKIVCS